MKNKFEKLVKEAKKVTLTKEEKGLVQANLVSFMKTYPVRNPEMARQYYQRSKISSVIQKIKNMPIITIATALALLLGTGTAFAAQGSLPGNPLYPVKTNVDEPIEEALTFSTQGKAQLEAQLATERLQEAEQLSTEGKLNASTESEIQSNFEEHASNEANLVTQLQAEGNTQAASSVSSGFESDLSAHQNILNVLKINGINGLNVGGQGKVNASTIEATTTSQNIGVQSSTTVSANAEATLTAVTGLVNETKQLLINNESKIQASVFAQAQAQINDANTAVVQAKVQITADAYGSALALLQQAQQLAQEVNITVRSSIELNIGVGSGVNASTGNENASGSGSLNINTIIPTTTGIKVNPTTTVSSSSGIQLDTSGATTPNIPITGGVSGSAGGSGGGGLGLGGL